MFEDIGSNLSHLGSNLSLERFVYPFIDLFTSFVFARYSRSQRDKNGGHPRWAGGEGEGGGWKIRLCENWDSSAGV